MIDAYHGTTTFYLAEPDDPIIRAYAQGVSRACSRRSTQMPAGLRRHVRYPEGIFGMQAAVYSTYHMTSPAVFYNKEDQWEVPTIDSGGQAVRMAPYYTIMRLPGEQRAEFIQMLPFTPRRRDNLASWLVARSDGDQYGQLMAFEFPKQKLVFGPRQVVARINQDQVISPQITLWNQQGSEVIQGTLMVIPIEESLLYVRPMYLRAQAGRIPELTRVIVAYQNSIVMERTLDAALGRLFSPEAVAARKAQPKDTAFVPGEADDPRRRDAGRRRDRHSTGGALGDAAAVDDCRPAAGPAHGRGPGDVPAGHRGAARRRLGGLRRRDHAAGTDPRPAGAAAVVGARHPASKHRAGGRRRLAGQAEMAVDADPSGQQVGDVRADRRAVLEAVSRAAADDPDVGPGRMGVDQEVAAGGVLVLADAGVEQGRPGQGREPAGQEVPRQRNRGAVDDPLGGVGIDGWTVPVDADLEAVRVEVGDAVDAGREVDPHRQVLDPEPRVAGRHAEVEELLPRGANSRPHSQRQQRRAATGRMPARSDRPRAAPRT